MMCSNQWFVGFIRFHICLCAKAIAFSIQSFQFQNLSEKALDADARTKRNWRESNDQLCISQGRLLLILHAMATAGNTKISTQRRGKNISIDIKSEVNYLQIGDETTMNIGVQGSTVRSNTARPNTDNDTNSTSQNSGSELTSLNSGSDSTPQNSGSETNQIDQSSNESIDLK